MVVEDSISVNGKLSPLCMDNPTEGEGYIIVARDLLQGVEALSPIKNIHPRSCALIAAHALECILKAYLWHRGKKEEIVKHDVRHDIVALWNMAYKEKTLGIPKAEPDWVNILGLGHRRRYYLRYQKGEQGVVHGGQYPELIPMAAELRKLYEMVEPAIKG